MTGGGIVPGGPAEGENRERKGAKKEEGMREVKILMLHGYTQSGPLFRSKTRALEKLLVKALAPARLKPMLFYPTAPNPLSARDIPGYQPPDDDADQAPDAWAWFRKDEATASYRLLPEGMRRVAACIRDDAGGRVDGAVGFSQGGFMAAAVAAALETRPQPRQPPPADAEWVAALRAANGGRALRFAAVYSGFFAPQPALGWLYAPRAIATPTLHFLGSLDTVVDEARSRGLVERCADGAASVVVHPGGHYVPVAREWVGPLVGFVRAHAGSGEKDEDEAAADDGANL